MPISTFPRHDYDEDEYLLKPAGLRDTHSEGKVRGHHLNQAARDHQAGKGIQSAESDAECQKALAASRRNSVSVVDEALGS